MVKNQLSISEIIELLEKPLEPEKTLTVPPCKPKGGQIFLYQADEKGKEGKSLDSEPNFYSSFACTHPQIPTLCLQTEKMLFQRSVQLPST